MAAISGGAFRRMPLPVGLPRHRFDGGGAAKKKRHAPAGPASPDRVRLAGNGGMASFLCAYSCLSFRRMFPEAVWIETEALPSPQA